MSSTYDEIRDDGIQNGIDDNPNNDPQKGAAIGGIGGVAVGAMAGAAMGPLGAVIGAAIGGVAGAAASGAAVAAIDDMDDDDTVTGLHNDHDNDVDYAERPVAAGTMAYDNTYGTTAYPGTTGYQGADLVNGPLGGNQIPGIQTGGTSIDGTPDTRGLSEKAADAVTGDKLDDKTGKRIDY
jgi:hypothetical protein